MHCKNLLFGICFSTSTLSLQAQSFVWGGRFGGVGEDVVREIYVDAAGTSYTTGYFTDNANFALSGTPSTITSAGFLDVFVQKTNTNGNLVWAKSLGGMSDDYGTGIVADGQGNVYITGVFANVGDFDPGPGTTYLTSVGQQDIFIVKLDVNGDLVWAKSVGSPEYDESVAIGTDENGNVYVHGYFNGTGDFDPGTGTVTLTNSGTSDNFALKLDVNGNLVWAKQYGGNGPDIAMAMKVAANGDQYITGLFSGTADFDPGTGVQQLNNGTSNMAGYVLKLNNAGNFQYAGVIRSNSATGGSVTGYDIDIDVTGNAYLTGTFGGIVDFDPGTGVQELTSASAFNDNGFVAKYNPSGGLAWAKPIESDEAVISYSIDVSPSGKVMASGYMETTTDFDPDPAATFELDISSGNSMGAYITILDNTGDFINAFEFGGVNFADYHGAATDGSGSIYISGGFETTVDIDPDPDPAMLEQVAAMDFRDNYLIKLSASVAALPDEPEAIGATIFPNPATDNTVLEITNDALLNGPYIIYDKTGRQVQSGKLTKSTLLNVSEFSHGIYIIKLPNNQTLRFTKN